MKLRVIAYSLMICGLSQAAPHFVHEEPLASAHYSINGAALCATAKETLAYINQGTHYDPLVIHDGKSFKIPLSKVKATLQFVCQHQNQINDPAFVKKHFDFFRWYPDLQQAKNYQLNKPLLMHLPNNKILMTKYYVHLANAATKPSSTHLYALHGLPHDEDHLSFEEAESTKGLLRYEYGKQAILKGALSNQHVPVLAYLNRDDLEAALLQGTLIAKFQGSHPSVKTFNVHRNNHMAYDKLKSPYQQERYWYFKQVQGIKGYGKDADHKITVNTEVTFAADLEQFGLGKMLLVQYPDSKGQTITRAGIFADTGGAFQNNQYQVDFLSGSYPGRSAFAKATRHLPDYVQAYFMVLKD